MTQQVNYNRAAGDLNSSSMSSSMDRKSSYLPLAQPIW